jgi:fatty acid synthase subunit alpha
LHVIQSITKAIFPNAIDGDLLKLVHLSNGFKCVPGAPSIKVGDHVTSTSKIASVINSDSGKTIQVKGTVYLIRAEGRVPVIDVDTSFLYRGHFDDFETTFEKTVDPPYKVVIESPQDVAVLQSKEWFEWENEQEPLLPGTTLVFKTESEYRYKSKDTFSSVEVIGEATVAAKEGKKRVRVATVTYSSTGPSKGNPVLEYFKRRGTALDQPVLFESPYTITSTENPSVIVTPASNEDYSLISGDVNPIHVSPYFADFAGLPGTITHGMFTSAAARRYVEQVAAENRPERVVSYKVNFVGMVLPNSTLHVILKHIGQTRGGNKLIEVSTIDAATGDKVLAGTAEVAQASTAYVFTGQGSQEQGMGMDLYASSEVARRVWDEADKHLGDVYGFSIIDIVKNNPQVRNFHSLSFRCFFQSC